MLEEWESKTLETAQQIAHAATGALDHMRVAFKALDYWSNALPNLIKQNFNYGVNVSYENIHSYLISSI